jgi:hypothetical protein
MEFCELFYPDIVLKISNSYEDDTMDLLPDFNKMTAFDPRKLKEKLFENNISKK